jgi:hypothetical protein
VFDIADQLGLFDFVVDTFALERNHIAIKAVATHIRNLRCFEQSLLSSALTAQHRQLCAEPLGGRLIGKTAVFPGSGGAIVVADKLSVDGLAIAIDDMVFNGAECGEVLAAAQENVQLFVVVRVLAVVGDVLPNSKRYRWTGHKPVGRRCH